MSVGEPPYLGKVASKILCISRSLLCQDVHGGSPGQEGHCDFQRSCKAARSTQTVLLTPLAGILFLAVLTLESCAGHVQVFERVKQPVSAAIEDAIRRQREGEHRISLVLHML